MLQTWFQLLSPLAQWSLVSDGLRPFSTIARRIVERGGFVQAVVQPVDADGERRGHLGHVEEVARVPVGEGRRGEHLGLAAIQVLAFAGHAIRQPEVRHPPEASSRFAQEATADHRARHRGLGEHRVRGAAHEVPHGLDLGIGGDGAFSRASSPRANRRRGGADSLFNKATTSCGSAEADAPPGHSRPMITASAMRLAPFSMAEMLAPATGGFKRRTDVSGEAPHGTRIPAATSEGDSARAVITVDGHRARPRRGTPCVQSSSFVSSLQAFSRSPLYILLQYAPWLATSYVAWTGILVALCRARVGDQTAEVDGHRRRGGVPLSCSARARSWRWERSRWPTSFEQSKTSDRRLDRFMSEYQFSEYHEVRTHAPVARVEAAMREVSFADIPVAMYLMRARGAAAGRGGAVPITTRPILDLMATPGTGFLPLDTSDPRELVYGMAGAPWANGPKPPVRSPEQFLAYSAPGNIRVAFDLRIVEEGDGVVRVSTETRARGNDTAAQRTFARYWRVVYPGSAIIRRVWLDAIVAKAEQG